MQKEPSDWSRDGATILVTEATADTRGDLVAITVATGVRTVVAATDALEQRGRFSPDDRWVAYTSDESGRTQVYVQPFPPTGAKWQISTGGGLEPKWRADGRELYYLEPGRGIMAVSVDFSRTFEHSGPTLLLAARAAISSSAPSFEVTPDGRRFLIRERASLPDPSTPMHLILNLPALLTAPRCQRRRGSGGRMNMDHDIWCWDATRMAGAISRREISSREAVQSCLARKAAVNPRLNAVTVDLSGPALEAADRADAAVARGDALGLLHGVPVTVKENVDQAGCANTNGIPAFRDVMARDDSPVVSNWKAAGAVIIGRTNTPGFSFRLDTENDLRGRTYSPWSETHTPGGFERRRRVLGGRRHHAAVARQRHRRLDPLSGLRVRAGRPAPVVRPRAGVQSERAGRTVDVVAAAVGAGADGPHRPRHPRRAGHAGGA